MHRDHPGRNDTYYVNKTGRNDIIGAKVARDNKNIYFYVETDQPLTSIKDPNWMLLFIDVDRNKQTGWYGYDLVINRISPENGLVTIEKNIKGKWMWTNIGNGKFVVSGNRLEIEVEKSILGLTDQLDFEFKWSDNLQDEGNIMDFYINGDVAPGGRFNYVYTAK